MRGWRTTVRLCCALLVVFGCADGGPPEITAGVDACATCNMVIDTPNQACAYVAGGVLSTFDSPACLLRSYDALAASDRPSLPEIYFADYRTGALRPAGRVSFVLTTHVRTVMNGGVICFADAQDARAQVTHDDEQRVDWRGYRLLRGDPDRTVTAEVTPDALIPPAVTVQKGDLVELVLAGTGLQNDLRVGVRGYEHAGEVLVPASGERASIRLWALRPGDGFPIVIVDNGRTLGALKVEGPHTSDEEAM